MAGMDSQELRLQLDMAPEQFAEILRLVYLGEWVVNSQHDDEHQDGAATASLQLLLALGAQLSPDTIGRDEETGLYYVNEELTGQWQDRHIEDYSDHVFWQELAQRLAERDLAAQLGVPVEELDPEEQVAQLRPLRERYWHELDHHGLERVELPPDPDA